MTQAAVKQDELFEDEVTELPDEAWAKITTLKGDIRDVILKWYERQERAWNAQSELEQKRSIFDIESFAAKVVREAVRVVATRGFDSIPVTISKAGLDVEKGIVATVSIARTKENVVDINACLGMAIQLVPLGIEEFMGERAPAKPDVIGPLRIPDTVATGPAVDARTAPATAGADTLLGATEATGAEEPHDPETGELPPKPAVATPGAA